MSQSIRTPDKNILLAALSDSDYALLEPHFTRQGLARRDVLVKANAPIAYVYFPESGIASTVAMMTNGRPTEVGIFGRDGVSATCLLLGSDQSPHETFIQVGDGEALRIETVPYLDAVRRSETLRTILLRYVQTNLVQAAQSNAATAHHRIESRLARWLLMCHDRVDADEIPLTHEFIGMMIAAERSGVTISLHILEGAGMIYSKRGRVIIRDRDKLEDLAGDSYGVPETEYRKLIGPFGKTIVETPTLNVIN